MKNEFLFRILERVDPDVAVSAEGEPATYATPATKAGYNTKNAYPSVTHWGECYKINCPFCGDTRQRLFFCHLAGATVRDAKVMQRRFSIFLCVCHNERCHVENPEFAKWLIGLGINKGPIIDMRAKGSIYMSDQSKHIFAERMDTLPAPCFPIMSDMVPQPVKEYMQYTRGFDLHELQATWGVGYSPAGAVYERRDAPEGSRKQELRQPRIIVPVVMGRRLMGWQGRIPWEPQNKDTLKYFSSPNMKKSKLLFNFDRAVLSNYLVLVEGVFDAMRMPENAVCMFGKDLSSTQRQAIRFMGGSLGGIVLLDPDAKETAEKLVRILNEEHVFGRGAVLGQLPDSRDPAELPGTYLHELTEYYAQFLRPLRDGESVNNVEPEDMLQGFSELEDSLAI